MSRLIVGNWKMHLRPDEAVKMAGRLEGRLALDDKVEVVVCPPYIDLPALSQIPELRIKVGAQNAHYEDEGAFTGEISAAMLRGLAEYVIIGHSERRLMYENDTLIAKKLAAALRNGLTPILCIGEHFMDREENLTAKIITDQLTAGLSMLTGPDIARIVIAYEPVWAIGTGRHATPDEIKPALKAIRTTLEELYGAEAFAGVRVLYGGSVDPDNAAAFLRINGIDGLLVGGASLNYESFAGIVNAAQSLK